MPDVIAIIVGNSILHQVYEGMIVGETIGDKDMVVNVVRAKHASSIHVTTGAEDRNVLPPPRRMEIEDAIGWIQDDEVIEITPTAVRIRKRILNEADRLRAQRSGKKKL